MTRAAEATRDPIWAVEEKVHRRNSNSSLEWCSECEGYVEVHWLRDHRCADGAMDTLEAVAFDPEGFYAFWRFGGGLFLSREEAEAWAKRREHHYPEGWRVFCYALPEESELTSLLRAKEAR